MEQGTGPSERVPAGCPCHLQRLGSDCGLPRRLHDSPFWIRGCHQPSVSVFPFGRLSGLTSLLPSSCGPTDVLLHLHLPHRFRKGRRKTLDSQSSASLLVPLRLPNHTPSCSSQAHTHISPSGSSQMRLASSAIFPAPNGSVWELAAIIASKDPQWRGADT